ncbi:MULTISPECIES: hypothetical protein [Burkholderia cepacia complex]|uniref:hypothetical protein n=1 Tax=Burkholderia cepacia complex TaxID=87882 RepID=UPI0020115A4A|nr:MULTISPECIES: hypothetical protein [Burkholderia cepacia complex]
MSKGSIRLPARAIEDGRIGTARVRDSGIVNRAVAFGLSDEHVARIDAACANEIESVRSLISPSPIERMQQLGRMPKGRMNKTEAAYADVLAARLHAGEILWFRFEALKLRLADRTFITIDFPVITAGGALEFHEVKGRWTDDARAKTKMAAEQFPFRFLAIQRDGRHGWRIEDLTGRSW